MPKKFKKEVNLDLLKKLYEEGATIASLAERFKMSYTAMRNRMVKAGCELRKQGLKEIELPADLGEGSLRELAKKHGVSYQTIANRKKQDNG